MTVEEWIEANEEILSPLAEYQAILRSSLDKNTAVVCNIDNLLVLEEFFGNYILLFLNAGDNRIELTIKPS